MNSKNKFIAAKTDMVIDKEILRMQMRNMLSNYEISIDSSKLLLQNILPLVNQVNIQNIAIYHAYGKEISLDNIIQYLQQHKKQIYQPIAYKNTKKMSFELVHNSMDKPAIFYADNYVIADEIDAANLDMVILPVLAVDRYGHRLGKGGGYYDTTFSVVSRLAKRPIFVGAAFACQMIDEIIHVDDWDINMDYFVSEVGLVKFD